MEEGVVVGVVEVGIVMAAVEDPRQEVHDAEVGQGVEVANDAQEHAVLQVIDLCLEVAGMLFKKNKYFPRLHFAEFFLSRVKNSVFQVTISEIIIIKYFFPISAVQ